MKRHASGASWWILGLLLLITWTILGHAEPKFIRLRNAVISTAAPADAQARLRVESLDRRVSGLYLIQLRGPVQPSWRDTLRAVGVDLVRFVPEDAFVARLRTADPAQVRRLPFVQWLGEYQAGFKIHPDLKRRLALQQAGESTTPLEVCVLLSPWVPPQNVAHVRTEFTVLRAVSRTSIGFILRGRVNSDQLANLAASEVVLWIEPAPRMHLADEISSKIVCGGRVPSARPGEDTKEDASPEKPAGAAAVKGEHTASAAEHATLTQELGLDGRGVLVAVVDSGLCDGDNATLHPDLTGRVDGYLYYGALTDAADQHGHGTHVAGIIAGDGTTGETDSAGALYGLGIAPKAHLLVQRVFDASGQDQLPPFEVLTQDAVRAGAAVASNSWADDVQGRYDLSAAQFDALVRDADPETPGDQPLLLNFAAGNAGPGPQTIGSPAVAKNVIAIGASQNDRFDFSIYTEGRNAMADFSSRGPCEDGRTKPDVVAPGTWIASLQSAAASDVNAWAAISPNYQFQGGTSQAEPHVAGAAAVFVQAYREKHNGATPSPALIKAALVNSALDMNDGTDAGPAPNFAEGWGRVALTNLFASAQGHEYVEQGDVLSTGQVYERRLIVANSEQPLKIVLVYTDVPGLPAALPALVNDLDLEMTSPNGKLYRGNQFLKGESVPGPTANDNINNVEVIYLRHPLPGEHIIRVRARNVAEDIHGRDDVPPEQDFALAISGGLPTPGVPVLIFDRSAYSAPGLIGLEVIDPALADQASVQLRVTSSSEPAGELVQLSAAGGRGIFHGTVTTAAGMPAPDGQLQVQNGDRIEASYQSGPVQHSVTAVADLVPPRISGVTVTNHFGKAVITWQTDEPASSAVSYATNSSALLSVTNQVLTTNHAVELQNLAPDSRYLFSVGSTDEAGNRSEDNNGGVFYDFVAAAAAAVLLVDAYVPDDPQFQTPVIPLTSYTEALDQSHVSYEVWDLSRPDAVSPSADDLRPFQVVIWRLSDSLLGTATLSAAQQSALTAYLNTGGSIFISSMELLSRLGPNSAFRTNVLQVQSFMADAGAASVRGADNDPVGNGMEFPLDYSAYNSDILQGDSPDKADTLVLSTNAAPIFFESASNHVAGLRFPRKGYESLGRVVFLSFPLDAVPEAGEAPNNRATLLRNSLNFLAPGLGGVGSLTLDRAAYRVPDLMTLEVADSDLAGQGQVAVRCSSSSDTNGTTAALFEIARQGIFQGTVAIQPAPGPVLPGQLAAKAGDTIRVEYDDASTATVVSAQAVIDTEAPRITNVQVDPGYEQAVVRWTTSKPADGLVQFGESSFLSRTAYGEELQTAHELALVALQPDRTYYFQIASRDHAGNPVLDDNQGKLYTFRTLKPLSAPWFDALESPGAATNWMVVSGQEQEAIWTLGAPNNSQESAAHSGANAWGSNLNGAALGFADTMLISPAVELAGGSAASLHFWQSCSFAGSEADTEEYGRVYVSTNNTADWILLREYGALHTPWVEEALDLTRYVGHVVRLAWRYWLFTDVPGARPGWLIDDLSVTVTNPVSGTVQVMANLAQGSFTLAGPATRRGQGWSSTFTNLPTGEYVLRFGDVPYYQTPPPQTNLLAGNPLVLRGNYTFPDANGNGLSDSWEEQYFHGVAALHPATLDSDNDGFSDYAEFMAGTDPIDPVSNLHLFDPVPQPGGALELRWSSALGHMYRILSSRDALTWTPASEWLRASSDRLVYSVGNQAGSPTFFRLETKP